MKMGGEGRRNVLAWLVCSATTQERLLIILAFYYQLYSFLFAQVFKHHHHHHHHHHFKRHINNGRYKLQSANTSDSKSGRIKYSNGDFIFSECAFLHGLDVRQLQVQKEFKIHLYQCKFVFPRGLLEGALQIKWKQLVIECRTAARVLIALLTLDHQHTHHASYSIILTVHFLRQKWRITTSRIKMTDILHHETFLV